MIQKSPFYLFILLHLLMKLFYFYIFRFSKRYELPLLVQSVVMNVTMFLMIHLCVKVKRGNANNRERTFLGLYSSIQLNNNFADTMPKKGFHSLLYE